MGLFSTRKFLLLILLLGTGIARGQVAFNASIKPAEIYKNEYATLRIEIENCNDIKNLRIPSFSDFDVVSGPDQESGMSNVNGVSKTYMAISYVLKPHKAGKFSLGNASALLSGKQYTSGALKLLVKNGEGKSSGSQAAPSMQLPLSLFDDMPAPPSRQDYSDYYLKPGESIPDKVNKNMHVLLQTNKTSCFVGEPIVATYKLYTRLESQSKMSKAPSFNGFSVVDMLQPDQVDSRIEKLDGREYNAYTIRKSQLFPLQPGDFEVEPATIDNEVKFIKQNGNSNFGADNIIVQTVSLSSKPLTVHVKPLPEAGKPANFNGAVGKFDIDAQLEKTSFGQDESGKLVITIGGAGNLHLLTAPDIRWPQGTDAFDAKVKDNVDASIVPESGNKIFEIPFTANAEGNYQLPSIAFSYFDPTTASYKTVASKPIDFTVTKGSGKPRYDVDTLAQKQAVSFSEKMFTNRHWIIAVIALLMMLGLFIWQKRDAAKRKALIIKQALEEKENLQKQTEVLQAVAAAPQNPLAQTEACLNSPDCHDFYTLLNAEMKTWLAGKFALPLQDITAKKIIAAIDKAGIDNVTALELEKILQEVEWQLYTPFERSDAMNQMYSRAQAVLQTICLHKSGKATL